MRAGESVDVADGMAWSVEDVEASVAEVIEGFEAADVDVGVAEVDLADVAAGEVGFEAAALRIGWVSGHEDFFEPRTDDQICTPGKRGRVTSVVEVPSDQSALVGNNKASVARIHQ